MSHPAVPATSASMSSLVATLEAMRDAGWVMATPDSTRETTDNHQPVPSSPSSPGIAS